MTEEWYYGQNGQQIGPLSTRELRDKLANGAVAPSDLVWREGMSNWVSAAETRELCPQVASVAPTKMAPPPRVEAPPRRPERGKKKRRPRNGNHIDRSVAGRRKG